MVGNQYGFPRTRVSRLAAALCTMAYLGTLVLMGCGSDGRGTETGPATIVSPAAPGPVAKAPAPTAGLASQREAPAVPRASASPSPESTGGPMAGPEPTGAPPATAPANAERPDPTPTSDLGRASIPDRDAGLSGPDADAPAVKCPQTTYAPGDNRESLMHDGRARRFSVYVPASLLTGEPAPLIVDFHGNGSSGAGEARSSGWKEKADEEGFVVAFPDGVGNGWNVGNCCGQALDQNIDDVGFARAVVETVSEGICIDPKRVYAAGMSNGGGLTHRLACEAADVFAAVAATSADLVTDPCTPSRPISELSVRGQSDRLVAYEGGNTGSTGWYSPGAKGTLELWRDINGCTGSPKQALEYCETYDTCDEGVEVTLCSLPRTGHILYGNSLGFSVADVAWDMFLRQPIP